MKIKEILEKEFGGQTKVYEERDHYVFYVSNYTGRTYFLLEISKKEYISYISFYINSGSRFALEEPITDLNWLIFCIKRLDFEDNLYMVLRNKNLKREFIINGILND